MEVVFVSDERATIVTLKGRLDGTNASNFESQCVSLVQQKPQNVIFDGTQLTYVSGAGLRSWLTVLRQLSTPNGVVAITNLNDHVQQVLEIVGLGSLATLYDTVEEALNKVAIPPQKGQPLAVP
jgi:anti-anti-sigma factor